MAVRLDAEMLVASVGHHLAGRAREQRARLRDLGAEDGGARAVIADPDRGPLEVWVGVVDGALTGECDCPGWVPGRLCEHSVAVALAALDNAVTFSSVPPRTRGVEPEEPRFAEIAAGLAPGMLIGLVTRQAAADRYFAAMLLACAGRLPPSGPAEIHAVRRLIADAADVPNHRRWDLYDLVKAGRAMVAELELLALRPPTADLLAVAEEAIVVWAGLSGYLNDAWETFEAEPEEIGAALAEVHLQLCQARGPEPLKLAARLAQLVSTTDAEQFLDVAGRYRDLLGPHGMAEFQALLAQRYGVG